MVKIYTKTGDDGTTGLFGGGRVPKDDARLDAFGTIDELNAILGVALTEAAPEKLRSQLTALQHELFDAGADFATPLDAKATVRRIGAEESARLEKEIDAAEADLAPLTAFILPGGSEAAALLHLARTVCRRAERAASALLAQRKIRPELLAYLNRLSDWLFVMARYANRHAGVPDVTWKKK